MGLKSSAIHQVITAEYTGSSIERWSHLSSPRLMSDSSYHEDDPLHVVCVYTLSGQYGQGQRAALYILITALCFADQSELIANIALGSSLLFGLSSAFHIILLAFTAGIGGGKCIKPLILTAYALLQVHCSTLISLVPPGFAQWRSSSSHHSLLETQPS